MKKIFIIVPVALIVLGGGYYYFSSKSGKVQSVQAVLGTLEQVVSVTGKTKPVNAVDLGFEINGTIVSAPVDAGSQVVAGDILARLDQSQLVANLLEATANFNSQKAKLEDIKAGARPEDIAIAEAQVESANSSVADAEHNILNKISDSYTKSDDAVYGGADTFFVNPHSQNPELVTTINNSQLRINLLDERLVLETVLPKWKVQVTSLQSSSPEIISESKADLEKVRKFLEDMGSAVNNLTPTNTLSESQISALKSSISLGRTNIATAINNLQSAEEKLNSARQAKTIAERQLSLKKSGSTPLTIASEEAKLDQFSAQVALIEANMRKTVLRSPIDGTVTRQDAKIGQIASAGKSLVSVISSNNLEVEAFVPEINIGKIEVGNPVKITFDAFQNADYSGKLAFIDTAETLLDGVVNFKIKVSLDTKDSKLKSGLTANLRIISASKENVVLIPRYVVFQKEGKNFVKKTSEGKVFVDTQVSLGLTGEDGNAEVYSGLVQGDLVAVPSSK